MKTTYVVSNNTDYRTPFITTRLRDAVRVWRKHVKPRPNAGNAYAASFVRRTPAGDENLADTY